MDGKSFGLSEFLEKIRFPAPWTFDGLFFDQESRKVELRFSRPRGTRHH